MLVDNLATLVDNILVLCQISQPKLKLFYEDPVVFLREEFGSNISVHSRPGKATLMFLSIQIST